MFCVQFSMKFQGFRGFLDWDRLHFPAEKINLQYSIWFDILRACRTIRK